VRHKVRIKVSANDLTRRIYAGRPPTPPGHFRVDDRKNGGLVLDISGSPNRACGMSARLVKAISASQENLALDDCPILLGHTGQASLEHDFQPSGLVLVAVDLTGESNRLFGQNS
jgi:hypothetical protein